MMIGYEISNIEVKGVEIGGKEVTFYLLLCLLYLDGCQGCDGGLEHAQRKDTKIMNMTNFFMLLLARFNSI